MKDLAPQITRQRLVLEATYDRKLTEEDIRNYLLEVASKLDLRTYGDPIIHSPSGDGKEENQGFDAFVPLIDSGISLYVWTNEKFLSCVMYTCKEFSVEDAVSFTKDFFNATELVQQSF
ncbi:MAG TPA: S-adenosylmethionine decarboxylase [Verrucomicrobiae bacterium]|nr:S-adenosylmethionine decarboxylase [Verrucomicrobiae bacterium]